MGNIGPLNEQIIFRTLMEEARLSPDPSTQTAAVVINSYHEVYGINTFPDGVSPRLERPEKYLFIEHAERGAILRCAKHGVPTEGGTMYTLWAICADCARAVICAGITELVSHSFYKSDSHWGDSIAAGFTMLDEAGVKVRFVDFPVDPDGPGLLYNGQIVSF